MRPYPALLFGLLLFGSLAITANPTLAAWPHDPNNGNVPLSSFASLQVFPRMCPDGAGGAFIAWHELRATYDIYAQRINANGVMTWGTAGTAICTAAGDQANTALVPDGAGGVIIAWHDARAGGAFDIYVQRLNAAGVPQWTANGVAVCTATGAQSDPQIVSDGAGGAIITWPDSRGANVDIYAQRVNASGTPQWLANGVNICSAAGNQISPVIASDGAGGAVIGWDDRRSTLADIYAQRLNPSGAPLWTANGVGVSTAANEQYEPSIIADGAGGTILCWTDSRGASFDIYAQRLTSGGTALWQSNGVIVNVANDIQFAPLMTSDGAGGAIVVWRSYADGFIDLYAQRMNAGGVQQWQNTGVPISVAPADQNLHCLTSDGSGGAIIGWSDTRYGYYDIYAQKVDGNGVVRWADNGVAVSRANLDQSYPAIVTDGSGGAILAWHDDRAGAGVSRTYAQRIERFGQLGNPEATITSVRDTPNDQGGQVKVSWAASYLDVDPTYGIYEYRLWRSVPQSAATAVALEAERTTTDSDEATETGKWLVLPDAANAYAWELVGTQPVAILPSYSLVAATTGDSVSASNPRTAFMIEARAGLTASASRWFSAPDSGYSVDNLPPATPAQFTGTFPAGAHHLNWHANAEADIAGYRLYRGATADFVPSPATLISSQADVGYVAVTFNSYFYKLSAVDVHGNESAFALLAAGTTGVGDASQPTALHLASPEPNPAHTFTRIDFELPRDSDVSLAVYDAGGRMVRTLFRGTHEAGRTGTRWNLRDDSGRDVPNGIYFVRLEAAGRTLTRRMIAIR